MIEQGIRRRSLDELEKELWACGPSLLDLPETEMLLLPGDQPKHCERLPEQSLNGAWEMAFDGDEEQRLEPSAPWKDAVQAQVPCSVHTALFQAGVIPDPTVGRNDKIAREYCYKTWWFRRSFRRDPAVACPVLCFAGICYYAKVWLNGVYLGEHKGMFGGPEFEVGALLREENTLVVKIENAPADPQPYTDFMDNDEGWKQGVVINCVYGWHYACLPSRGIWDAVTLQSRPRVLLEKPFLATADAGKGLVDLCLRVQGAFERAEIVGTILPENFSGEACCFDFCWENQNGNLRLRLKIPNSRQWWPLDRGEQNLYRLELSFYPQDGLPQHFSETFGIRTIEMAPMPGGPREDQYNWQFVVNGKPIFVKGVNWCTTDVLLRFTKERYDRFLELAALQHIQLLRAWGGGMPESDYFYDRCDRLGIMVMQEWPTSWDSHKLQPVDVLCETVRYAVPRLRNHPSLALWCGGNESSQADGETMDAMARLTFELDGSRPFHRTSPWGGEIHNYDPYWNMRDMDTSLQLDSPFLGEFGMASAPNLSSVLRYLDEKDKTLWPPDQRGSFCHHTPKFNQPLPHTDMEHIGLHLKMFSKGETMEDWIWASQMSQATCIRHTLEAYRSRWPRCAAVCYYKLTDVYPACSWSTVDYYGVPKLSYYFIADSYAPLHGCVLFDSLSCKGGLDAPVVLLDDKGEALGLPCEVKVTAYDGFLRELKSQSFPVEGSGRPVTAMGTFQLTEKQAQSEPLLLTVETLRNGESVDRTFYWQNFRDRPGCLLELPKTSLKASAGEGAVKILNTGKTPAVGVSVACREREETFLTEDSLFWLAPGEVRVIRVNQAQGVTVGAWNAREEPASVEETGF